MVTFTARKGLVFDIHVGAAARESLLQKDLVIADLELVRRCPCLVVLEVCLFSIPSLALTKAVGTFG